MNTTKGLCSCAFCEFIYLCSLVFIVTLSREMKTTRKTSAPLAPAGPLTGGRDDGVAAAP